MYSNKSLIKSITIIIIFFSFKGKKNTKNHKKKAKLATAKKKLHVHFALQTSFFSFIHSQERHRHISKQNTNLFSPFNM